MFTMGLTAGPLTQMQRPAQRQSTPLPDHGARQKEFAAGQKALAKDKDIALDLALLAGTAALPAAGALGRVALGAQLAMDAGDAEAGVAQKMLQGLYRGFAGENLPAKTAFGNDTYFVTPQRRAAEYYARRRSDETGKPPHVEMILAEQGSRHAPYRLGIPRDKWNRDVLTPSAKRVDPDEVVSRSQLYRTGGVVR
jgi:hypothetical protein